MNIPKATAAALAKLIFQKAKEHFENAENRAKFEEWYLEKYGVPYVWKVNERK